MGGLLTSDLARLGALPALRLGVGFALPVGAARAMQLHGDRVGSETLASLGASVLLVLAIVLWVVVTWFRDDDALEAGALVALTVGGAALVAELLLAGRPHGPFAEAAWQLIVGETGALRTLALLAPACTAAVWIARRISSALGWRYRR